MQILRTEERLFQKKTYFSGQNGFCFTSKLLFLSLCRNGNGEIHGGSFCRWEVAEGSYLSVSTSSISKLEKPAEF